VRGGNLHAFSAKMGSLPWQYLSHTSNCLVRRLVMLLWRNGITPSPISPEWKVHLLLSPTFRALSLRFIAEYKHVFGGSRSNREGSSCLFTCPWSHHWFIACVWGISFLLLGPVLLSFPVKNKTEREAGCMKRFRLCRYYCTSASRGIAATRSSLLLLYSYNN